MKYMTASLLCLLLLVSLSSATNVEFIRDIQYYDPQTGIPMSPYASEEVTLIGDVYAVKGTLTEGGFYIQDSSAGINYYAPNAEGISIGDRIRVTATVYTWEGEIYLHDADVPQFEILSSGPEPEPKDFTVSDLISTYENVGWFVRVIGTISDLGVDGFILNSGGDAVTVHVSGLSGIDLSIYENGNDVVVRGACVIRNGAIQVWPRYQGDLEIWDPQTLYVAPSGSNIYGDGSEGNPYGTIQFAVGKAQPEWDTVILATGTYVGDGNRDIDFLGKDLTLRSASGNPDLSIINCQGSQSEPHIGFHIHKGETVVVEGITIRNAVTSTTMQGAIYIEGIESSTNLFPFEEIQPVNDGGGHLQLLDSKIMATQGIGFLVLGEGAVAETINCDFLNNSENGAFWSMSSSMIGADSCRFNNNGQSGVVSQPEDHGGVFYNCEMISNGSYGVFAWNYGGCTVDLNNCLISENMSWGCYVRLHASLKAGTIVEHNYEGGVFSDSDGSAYAEDSIVRNNLGPGIFTHGNGGVGLTRSQITGNQGMGLFVYDGSTAHGSIEDCVFANNAGPGIMFFPQPDKNFEPPLGEILISGTDIVGNAGDAIVLLLSYFEDFQIAQSVIAFNEGLDIADVSQATLSPEVIEFLEKYVPDFRRVAASSVPKDLFFELRCTDIYGNLSDFSGPFAPFFEINGNFSEDPLFCDAAGGNLALNLGSPCLPGNHPDEADCGQIGALGLGCTGPNPHITEISDIPNDQGRQVHLEWSRSGLDESGSETPILGYAVFRKINPEAETKGFEPKDYPPGDWHYLLEVPAFGEEYYAVVAPTLRDSIVTRGNSFSTFFIRAMTADPTVFFDSAPDSGYSVDNLAPEMPTSIIIGYGPEGIWLDWDDAPEPDFNSYRIYNSDHKDFIPSPKTFVGETTVSEWPGSNLKYRGVFFKITTLDFARNESEPGEPKDVSGISGDDLPARTTLLGAVPNPFNPSTRLSFEMATAGHVRLKVYDAAGRLVATLVDEEYEVGKHEVIWNGKDNTGRNSAAGVYLYQLEVGAFSETKRMVLLK